MKTSNLCLKKSATTLFAMRFTLVIGILIFTISLGKSQNSTSIPDSEKAKSGNIQPANSTQTLNTITPNNTVSTSKKISDQSTNISDSDFNAKKTNVNTGTIPEIKQPESNAPQKLAEHAPYMNDPDYAAKKEEWIKNYPEEYNAALNKSVKSNF